MLHTHVQNWTDWLGLAVSVGAVLTIIVALTVAMVREQRKTRAQLLKALPRHPEPTFLRTSRFLGQYGLFDLWVGIDPEGAAGAEVVAVAVGAVGAAWSNAAEATIMARENVLLLDDGAHALSERAIREAGRRAGWILPSPVPAYIED